MNDDADQIDAGIGSHRVLHPDTRKWSMVLAIGATFVAIGIAMIVTKGDFLAWFITLFFATVAGVAALQLKGAGSHLELNADTFLITNFGRKTIERWDECAGFKVYRLTRTEQVVYDRARDLETHMGEMNRSISGRSAGLPDTFGMSAEELASLMGRYGELAVHRAWQRHAEAVEEFSGMITDSMVKAGQAVDIATGTDITTLPDNLALPEEPAPPEGMAAWPSFLVVLKQPRPDGSRHVVICVDVLSPISRWITVDTKRELAFDILKADELQIIDPDTKDIRRFLRDAPHDGTDSTNEDGK